MTLLQTLLELQQLDQEWDTKASSYQSVAQRLTSQPELQSKREQKVSLEKDRAAKQATMRDRELQLEGLQSKAKQIERDLYSGKVLAPRELDNLRKDGEAVRSRVSGVEDDLLTLMTEADEIEASLSQSSSELASLESAWDQKRPLLISEYQSLRARLKDLQARRKELRESLGRSELGLYDELRKRKSGIALAPVRDSVCQVCRVSVPSHKETVIAAGSSVVTCDGCGRILYPA